MTWSGGGGAYRKVWVVVLGVVLCVLLVVTLVVGILSLIVHYTDNAALVTGESPDMHVTCTCISCIVLLLMHMVMTPPTVTWQHSKLLTKL